MTPLESESALSKADDACYAELHRFSPSDATPSCELKRNNVHVETLLLVLKFFSSKMSSSLNESDLLHVSITPRGTREKLVNYTKLKLAAYLSSALA